MAVSTKDDKNKMKLSEIDATPTSYEGYSVKSANSGKNDGKLS